jgi:hypothetical protein
LTDALDRLIATAAEIPESEWAKIPEDFSETYRARKCEGLGLADLFREAFGPEYGFEPLGAEFSLTAAQMAELYEP